MKKKGKDKMSSGFDRLNELLETYKLAAEARLIQAISRPNVDPSYQQKIDDSRNAIILLVTDTCGLE